MIENYINVGSHPAHKLPDGYKMIRDMNSNMYYFIFNQKEYGPHKDRFIARNKAIEHNKESIERDMFQLSEDTINYLKSIK